MIDEKGFYTMGTSRANLRSKGRTGVIVFLGGHARGEGGAHLFLEACRLVKVAVRLFDEDEGTEDA